MGSTLLEAPAIGATARVGEKESKSLGKLRAQLRAGSAQFYPGLSCRVWYPVVERRKTGVLMLSCPRNVVIGWDLHFDILPERRQVERPVDDSPPWITSSSS